MVGHNTARQADPDARSLWHACQHGFLDQLTLLLHGSVDVNKTTSTEDTALLIATHYGHIEAVRVLLQHPQLNVNYVSATAGTALHVASHRGNAAIVSLLLDHGARVDEVTQDGFSALMTASQQGHEGVVSQLLQRHADVNCMNCSGFTALHMAAHEGRTEVVARLLQQPEIESKIRNKQFGGMTPLQVAIAMQHEPVAELLRSSSELPRSSSGAKLLRSS